MYRRRNSDDDLYDNDICSKSSPETINIEFRDVTYAISSKKLKDVKFLLNHVSGEIHSGELTAIIGPSGAGKTTLMNVLSGHRPLGSNSNATVTGSILVNGLQRDIARFRRMSSYVVQDCAFFVHFTVKETMAFAANFKLSENYQPNEKQEKVLEILDILHLADSTSTKVLNLSGGERKRLAVALELLGNPRLMFLDEPTSGLDSSTCDTFVSLLKSLANHGRTIVCTIHQPSYKTFEIFDKLFVMAKGHCIYQGSTTGLRSFLSALNFHCPKYYSPADFVLEKASENNGNHVPLFVRTMYSVRESTRISMENTALSNNCVCHTRKALNGFFSMFHKLFTEEYYHINRWSQFRHLFMREIKSTIKNQRLLAVRFLFHILAGLLLGGLVYDCGNKAEKILSILGFLGVSHMCIIIPSALPMLILFPLERKIIAREHLNCWYSVLPYFSAKVISSVLFQAFFVICFSSLTYWLSAQPNEVFRFVYCILIATILSAVAQAYGLIFGAGAEIQLATFLGTIVIFPLSIFCGYLIRFNAIPRYLQWARYLSFFAYAYEGNVIAIYGYNRAEIECESFCVFTSPSVLIKELGLIPSNFLLDVVGLLIIQVIFLLLAYVLLRWKLK